MSENESESFRPWRGTGASRRRFRRWFVDMPTLVHVGGEALACTIRDLSPISAGVRLNEAREVPLGSEAALELGGFGTVPAEVRSGDPLHLGLMFLHGEGHARELAHHLLSLPPARRVARRQARRAATLLQAARSYPCQVEDISRIGACVELDGVAPIAVGDEVVLSGETLADTAASVRWVDGLRLGLLFLEVLDAAESPQRADAPPPAASEAAPAAEPDDFLPGLKQALETHIREQVERRAKADPYSDWKQLIETCVDDEKSKLERLAKRYDQAEETESGRRVRELIDDWLTRLAEELKARDRPAG